MADAHFVETKKRLHLRIMEQKSSFQNAFSNFKSTLFFKTMRTHQGAFAIKNLMQNIFPFSEYVRDLFRSFLNVKSQREIRSISSQLFHNKERQPSKFSFSCNWLEHRKTKKFYLFFPFSQILFYFQLDFFSHSV